MLDLNPTKSRINVECPTGMKRKKSGPGREGLKTVLLITIGYNRRDLFVRGEPESGKIVAVFVSDDGLIVKRLQQVENARVLISDNSAYPLRLLNEEERLFGVAKAVIRKV